MPDEDDNKNLIDLAKDKVVIYLSAAVLVFSILVAICVR